MMDELEAKAILQEMERRVKTHQAAYTAREAGMLRRRNRRRRIVHVIMLIFRHLGMHL